MSGEFLGTFSLSVYKDKWIIIPAVFKKKFSPQAKQSVVITIGFQGNNLAIFPLDNWKEKISSLETGGTKEKDMLINLRHFATTEQAMEANGRIRIADNLIDLIKLEDKVIIKGEGKFFSVWNLDAYEELNRKILENHIKNFSLTDYQ